MNPGEEKQDDYCRDAPTVLVTLVIELLLGPEGVNRGSCGIIMEDISCEVV